MEEDNPEPIPNWEIEAIIEAIEAPGTSFEKTDRPEADDTACNPDALRQESPKRKIVRNKCRVPK